jgi:hypothetical protein
MQGRPWYGGDNDNITLLRPESFAAHAVHFLSRLSLEGDERDIQNANCEGKQEEAVQKAAGEFQKAKGKSLQASEWSEHNGLH